MWWPGYSETNFGCLWLVFLGHILMPGLNGVEEIQISQTFINFSYLMTDCIHSPAVFPWTQGRPPCLKATSVKWKKDKERISSFTGRHCSDKFVSVAFDHSRVVVSHFGWYNTQQEHICSVWRHKICKYIKLKARSSLKCLRSSSLREKRKLILLWLFHLAGLKKVMRSWINIFLASLNLNLNLHNPI